MTATAGDLRAQLGPVEPSPDDLERAAVMVKRANLYLGRGHTRDEAAVALCRTLRIWPADSDHGALVVDALRRRSRTERRAGRRPDAQRAARYLLEKAQTPTPAAVAGRVRDERLHGTAQTDRAPRVAFALAHDGPEAARFVAWYWRTNQQGPARAELARHMAHRWRWTDSPWIIRAMLEDGRWLVGGREPRSLRPGPLAASDGRPVEAADPSNGDGSS